METDEMSEQVTSPPIEVDFLSRVPIFSSMSREDLIKLAGLWKPTVRSAGQAIFQKGDPPRAMYVIREGKVAISVWTTENLELVLSVLGKGDFFGELALLDGSLRTATATSRTRTWRTVFLPSADTSGRFSKGWSRIPAKRGRRVRCSSFCPAGRAIGRDASPLG